MRIYKATDYRNMSRIAANVISAQVIMKPDSVLGLATGSTPIGAYEQLIEWYKKGDIDFSDVSTINLDEYVGLSRDNSQSYYHFMHENLFNQVNVKEESIHFPDGTNPDVEKACKDYEDIIRLAGGIDLQVLGIGTNGHIGFNEPGSVFIPDVHVVELAPSTIESNKRFFSSEAEVPRSAITVGIKTIMQAKKVLLLVSGKNKAAIIKTALSGPITPEVPASILQLHPDCTVVGDEDALSLI